MARDPVTMYLRQDAPGLIDVRRGGSHARLAPGTFADVPHDLVELVSSLGATKRSRPSGGSTDEAGDAGEEE